MPLPIALATAGTWGMNALNALGMAGMAVDTVRGGYDFVRGGGAEDPNAGIPPGYEIGPDGQLRKKAPRGALSDRRRMEMQEIARQFYGGPQ